MINSQSFRTLQHQLSYFASQSNFDIMMSIVFWTRLNQLKLQALCQQWLRGKVGHRIKRFPNNGANRVGDEGEIFSCSVNGEDLASGFLAKPKSQSDRLKMLAGVIT
jgi:hypothetical protein